MITFFTILFFLILFLAIVIVLISIRKIPVGHWGQVTYLGERLPEKYKDEGWRFLLLCPYLYDVILISKEKQTFTIITEKTTTPDETTSLIPVSITYQIIPELAINFLDSGSYEGIKEQFTAKTEQRIREWALKVGEGPSNWKELQSSQSEGISVLLKKIAPELIEDIPDYAQSVPTWIWLRYFSSPRPEDPSEYEKRWFENNWKRVTDCLETLNADQINHLKNVIKERKNHITQLSGGNGTLRVENLGIIVKQLNLKNIILLGEAAKEAEKSAIERIHRSAEEIEIKHVSSMISLLKEKHGMTTDQANEIVQTERRKVSKQITETKLSVSDNIQKTVDNILNSMFKK
jgi:regulator of protease activity HflC (stomatin/prohibitin superfamily)